jgi:hypothetical protein
LYDSAGGKVATKETRRKRAPVGDATRQRRASGKSGESVLAQVRLRADESAQLRAAMTRLNLRSTSDALREGLRLLNREAVEVAAAEEIRAFYQGDFAPVPEGVSPVDDADLAAADEAEW